MTESKTDRLRKLIRLPADKSDWEFTSVLISRPINFILLHLIGNISFITPNLLTIMGFISFIAAAFILFQIPSMHVLAGVLLFLRLILDDMDGMLARYRGKGSNFGSYLDKTTDILGFFVFFMVLSYCAFKETGDFHMFLIGSLGIFGLMGTGYVKWVVASMVENKRDAESSLEKDEIKHNPFKVLFTLIFVKIWAVNECDIMLFSTVGILFRLPFAWILYVLSLSQALQFTAMLFIRGKQAYKSGH
ncbi:MAG: CDP-alcohol phosphatidyltransferase family protein [Deltaproteobacteria bacterium]|nr:CDP-alcohol phosphatidyltransferase family protein [Deltaproteobacteria bacterium]